ncbi:hypothetical protein KFL_003690010, partial [Klebsormidium nitens]
GAGPSGTTDDTTQYAKVIKDAGCQVAVSKLRASCRRFPRTIALFRRKQSGLEVKVDIPIKTFTAALEAAQDGDIIELTGEVDLAWFSINKRVTIRGKPDFPALMCDKWEAFSSKGPGELMPFIEIQPSASGLTLGPDLIIHSSTDRHHANQTVAVFVRDGTKNVVFDRVTINGDAARKKKKALDNTGRQGGCGVIFGDGASGEMRQCRVFHHELSGVQARLGARVSIRDCEISSNGDRGVWAYGASEMSVDGCTIRENGQQGVAVNALPATITRCHISDNYLEGILLEWPDQVSGPDQSAARRRICEKGHVIKDNHIVQNDFGIVVEDGVAATLDGNVVERNKETGVYFDEAQGHPVAPLRLFGEAAKGRSHSSPFRKDMVGMDHRNERDVNPGGDFQDLDREFTVARRAGLAVVTSAFREGFDISDAMDIATERKKSLGLHGEFAVRKCWVPTLKWQYQSKRFCPLTKGMLQCT